MNAQTLNKQGAIQERAKTYLEREVFFNQSYLVDKILAMETPDLFSYDDIEGIYPNPESMSLEELRAYLEDELSTDWESVTGTPFEGERDTPDYDPQDDVDLVCDYVRSNAEPREIFEWWLVSKWLAGQLLIFGEPVLSDGQNHWWGRCTTGQGILQDGILQEIAAYWENKYPTYALAPAYQGLEGRLAKDGMVQVTCIRFAGGEFAAHTDNLDGRGKSIEEALTNLSHKLE